MLRLFIAIELPPPVTAALHNLQTQLQAVTPPDVVRWTRPEAIHLTLKFLGDVPAGKQSAVEQGIIKAAHNQHPFNLSIGGVGSFPNSRHPRVVWVGLGGEQETLHTLRDAVESAVAPLGYPTDRRPFSPHLTLGRVRRSVRKPDIAALGRALEAAKVDAPAQFRAEGISLMRSRLRPNGAVYTQLAYIKLEAADG